MINMYLEKSYGNNNMNYTWIFNIWKKLNPNIKKIAQLEERIQKLELIELNTTKCSCKKATKKNIL